MSVVKIRLESVLKTEEVFSEEIEGESSSTTKEIIKTVQESLDVGTIVHIRDDVIYIIPKESIKYIKVTRVEQ